MNILFAIDCLNIGGAQTFMLRLVRALAAEHTVVIYVLNSEGRDKNLEDSFLGDLNVRIVSPSSLGMTVKKSRTIGVIGNILYRLGYKTLRTDLSNWLSGRNLHNVIKREKITCINSHLFASDWQIFQAIERNPIHWIVSMHGCYETFLHGGYYEKFRPDYFDPDFIRKAEAIFGRANGIILASDKNKEIHGHLPQTVTDRVKQEKIYYGFRPKPFTPKQRTEYDIPEDSLIFGMVARGIEEKGWKVLLEAFTELMKEGHDAYLVLVCDLTEHIEELARQYRHLDRIRFIGPSYNPLELVSLMDVTLLPTYFSGESLPNSVIEYLYAGKPVIATDLGDISNMISYRQEKAGFLVPLNPSNQPDSQALQNAMRAYLVNPQLLIKHGNIARNAFQKFDMDFCVKSYLNFFKI